MHYDIWPKTRDHQHAQCDIHVLSTQTAMPIIIISRYSYMYSSRNLWPGYNLPVASIGEKFSHKQFPSIEMPYKCSSIFMQNVAKRDFKCKYLKNTCTITLGLLMRYANVSLHPLSVSKCGILTGSGSCGFYP